VMSIDFLLPLPAGEEGISHTNDNTFICLEEIIFPVLGSMFASQILRDQNGHSTHRHALRIE
jgi:hypothetical protein